MLKYHQESGDLAKLTSGDSRSLYGRLAPRSGMATKGLDVLAGVIDSDYRGR